MTEDTSARYRRFGQIEAPGISELYAALALGVADDAALIELIAALPRRKQQVNLVFGAARFLGAPMTAYGAFRDWLLANWQQTEAVVLSRQTQTNEAGRCALYLPILSRLPQPLALIEVGASAGLCLHPDRYSYRYRTDAAEPIALDPPLGPSPVRLHCRIDAASAPVGLPQVAWRAGVDLNPIDPSDGDAMAWLEALIWPGEHERVATLHAAAVIAAAHPVRIVRGDLVDEVGVLIDQAPPDATVVVFHTSVLMYLEPDRGKQFVQQITSEPRVTWISNEGAGVLPDVTAQVDAPVGSGMILAVNGRAVALTGPHGQTYRALP